MAISDEIIKMIRQFVLFSIYYITLVEVSNYQWGFANAGMNATTMENQRLSIIGKPPLAVIFKIKSEFTLPEIPTKTADKILLVFVRAFVHMLVKCFGRHFRKGSLVRQ